MFPNVLLKTTVFHGLYNFRLSNKHCDTPSILMVTSESIIILSHKKTQLNFIFSFTLIFLPTITFISFYKKISPEITIITSLPNYIYDTHTFINIYFF